MSMMAVAHDPRNESSADRLSAASFTGVLFSTDMALIQRAVAAGIDTILVDWEYRGKHARQAGADTEINHHTHDDLRRVRACTDAVVICRINSYGTWTAEEIEQAIAAGADEVLLPMVRGPREVEAALSQVHGRCGVGILIETRAAVMAAEELGQLPLARVYVGLNDLAIERGTPSIFSAIVDGTLEYVRSHFNCPFGFGGLTLPERGAPIACRLLIGELARLNCSFSFLRRSFHRDMRGRDLAVEVPRMHAALMAAFGRSRREIWRDQRLLHEAIYRAYPRSATGIRANRLRSYAYSADV